MGPKLEGLEAAGRRGLSDQVGEIVQGQMCFCQSDNSFSLTRVGDPKRLEGSAPQLPERSRRRTAQDYLGSLPNLFSEPAYIWSTFLSTCPVT